MVSDLYFKHLTYGYLFMFLLFLAHDRPVSTNNVSVWIAMGIVLSVVMSLV